MPGLNQQGPMGQGPMTGWKMGKCTNYGENRGSVEELIDENGVRGGRGFGRRRCRGFGRGLEVNEGRGLGRGRGFGWGRGRMGQGMGRGRKGFTE